MKSQSAFLLTVLLLLLPTYFFAQIVDASDVPPEIMQITTDGRLIVGLTAADQRPFYYVDSQGNLAGYDIDLAKRLAANLGVEPEFNRDAINYNDVVALVVSGKIDIALTRLGLTLSRAKYVGFSEPYLQLNHAVLINRLEFAKKTSEKNLDEYIRNYSGKLGVIGHSVYSAAARRNFPDAQIEEYETWDEAVSDLVAGKVPAIYRDSLEIERTQNSISGGFLYFKKIVFPDIPEELSIAVKFDNSQLLNWINTFLKTDRKKITEKELLEKYGND